MFGADPMLVGILVRPVCCQSLSAVCARWLTLFRRCGYELKITPTVSLFDMVMVQVVAVPQAATDPPPKTEPVAGVSVRVTLAFLVKVPEQLPPGVPQLMGRGELVTVPLPVPTS